MIDRSKAKLVVIIGPKLLAKLSGPESACIRVRKWRRTAHERWQGGHWHSHSIMLCEVTVGILFGVRDLH
jgi:hypothetical protein